MIELQCPGFEYAHDLQTFKRFAPEVESGILHQKTEQTFRIFDVRSVLLRNFFLQSLQLFQLLQDLLQTAFVHPVGQAGNQPAAQFKGASHGLWRRLHIQL